MDHVMDGIPSVLQCTVCQEEYCRGERVPVALPACGHTFCRLCLVRIHASKGSLKCPICRTEHNGCLPEQLPANMTVLSMLDTLEGLGRGGGGGEAQSQPTSKPPTSSSKSEGSGSSVWRKVGIGAGAVGGAVGLIVAAPLALTAVGFTSAGVAAGSLAASMMSSAAIANGGAIAAGSTVAVLQSAGAAGIGAAASAGLGSAGAALGGGLTALFMRGGASGKDGKDAKDKCKKEEEEKEEECGKDSDSDDEKLSSDDDKECDNESNKPKDDGGTEFIACGTRI